MRHRELAVHRTGLISIGADGDAHGCRIGIEDIDRGGIIRTRRDRDAGVVSAGQRDDDRFGAFDQGIRNDTRDSDARRGGTGRYGD